MFTVHNFRPFVKNDIEILAPEKEDVNKEKTIIINPLKLLFLLLTGKTNAPLLQSRSTFSSYFLQVEDFLCSCLDFYLPTQC